MEPRFNASLGCGVSHSTRATRSRRRNRGQTHDDDVARKSGVNRDANSRSSSAAPGPPSAASAAASHPSPPANWARTPSARRWTAPASPPNKSEQSSSARSSRPGPARGPRGRPAWPPESAGRAHRDGQQTLPLRPDTVIDAARMIRAGEADFIVAAGQESMTNAPHLVPGLRAASSSGKPRCWTR